jgi:N-acyl homoserine lactone hydrolase
MLASLEKLARCEAAGARIFFGHDGEFWKTAPQAPMMIA